MHGTPFASVPRLCLWASHAACMHSEMPHTSLAYCSWMAKHVASLTGSLIPEDVSDVFGFVTQSSQCIIPSTPAIVSHRPPYLYVVLDARRACTHVCLQGWVAITRKFTCRRLDEQTKLSDAVQRHMQPQAGQASMQALLQQYVEAGMDNLGLLLQVEHRPVSHLPLHSLPLSMPLAPVKCSDLVAFKASRCIIHSHHCAGVPVQHGNHPECVPSRKQHVPHEVILAPRTSC